MPVGLKLEKLPNLFTFIYIDDFFFNSKLDFSCVQREGIACIILGFASSVTSLRLYINR